MAEPIGIGANIGQTVKWTQPKLRRFKKLIASQPSNFQGGSKAVVTFEGNEFYVPYARYLIEYLEGQLGVQDAKTR